MKYKYKIGDKVKFYSIKSKEIKCKCCGHIEKKFTDILLTGIIEKRYYDLVIRPQEIVGEYESKILKDGLKVYRPYFSKIKPNNTEPCYKILSRGMIHTLDEKSLKTKNK